MDPHLNSIPVFSYKDNFNQTIFIRFDNIRKIVFIGKTQRSDSKIRVSIALNAENDKLEFYGERALKFMEYYKMVFPVMDLGSE